MHFKQLNYIASPSHRLITNFNFTTLWYALQQKSTQRLKRHNSFAVLENDGLSLKLAVNNGCNVIKSYIIRNPLELCKFQNIYNSRHNLKWFRYLAASLTPPRAFDAKYHVKGIALGFRQCAW